MVAKQMRTIEQRLGVRLLQRTTRRHQLTEVGRLYHERSKHAVAEVEAAEGSALEPQASPRGRQDRRRTAMLRSAVDFLIARFG
jgi:DNA-binding transcriptional LysR family regulator